MDFCVLVKVTRRAVSFWYQSDGNPYAPLVMKGNNEVPLYFYINGNDFVFGNLAKERFYLNDPCAYGNYFEIVKDPSKHFSIYGNKKPVKQLFYYGVEQCLSYFINTVLYKSDSIESYRLNFPLRFWFEADIEDKERVLIETLFTEAGYDNIGRIDFDSVLIKILSNKKVILGDNPILLLKGVDNNLYIELFKNVEDGSIGKAKLEGQGADPRIMILADMILEYILTQNSYLNLNKETEIGVLIPFVSNLIGNLAPIIKGEVELTDGIKYYFRVNAKTLDERLLYYSNDNIIFSEIDSLLKLNRINSQEVFLVLGSEEINTSYFTNKLGKKYPAVRGLDASHQKDALKSVFDEVIVSGYSIKVKTSLGPPPLPPFNGAGKEENKVKIKPPLPPAIKNGDAVNKDRQNGDITRKVPPLPPMVKKKPEEVVVKPKLPPIPPQPPKKKS